MRLQRTFFALCCFSILPLFAQTNTDRLISTLDDRVRVPLAGNRHPLARPEFEVGVPSPGERMERMILTLGTDPARAQALAELLANQQDPDSPQYHRWLTPEEFGKRFGVSDHDLSGVVAWLRSHGLEVEDIARGRRSLIFSGTVAQVEEAFHTTIRVYDIGGARHSANAGDPEIPKALAGVVEGVVALHDFRSKPAHTAAKVLSAPELNSGAAHYLGPADFATIYDVAPLYQNAINGTGQSVAVVARCNIHASDVQGFRSFFGLPANNPNIVLNGKDPGIVSNAEETEADLDVEWAGAIAQNASVQFVVSASTNSSDGVMLSAQYIVNNNLAPVMTLSFGLCEAAQGASGNAFINNLWQQAAAQGITVLVASGDNGAAGCDASAAATATQGQAVNGLCSSPNDVCVGGTEFNDSSNPSAYWAASANATTQGSALSYIPEMVWNESGAVAGGSQLWAGGGGASIVYAKPSWQTGPGVPADGQRDVPDVSLTAAGHDGYVIYQNGGLGAVGGTSAATPAFASLMAMAVQKTGGRLGNPNSTLYSMAASQASGGPAAFHDITLGNNSVPGVTGFTAGVGYDQGTGLGSVDAAQLINNWGGNASPSLQVSLSSSSGAVGDGGSANVTVTVGATGGFSSTVLLSAAGLPSGVNAGFSPASFSAPGSGTSTLTLSVGSQVAAGSYPITVSANGGSTTQNASYTLTVTPAGSFTLGLSVSSVSIAQGGAGSLQATVTAAGGFSAAVALSASGLPAGVTLVPTPSGFTAPGSGSSTLLIGVSAQATPGSYPVTVTASGGGVTQNAGFTLTVGASGSFTLSLSANSVSLAPGGSVSIQETVALMGSFNSSIALTVSGMPAGVTVTPGYAVLAAPGSGTNTVSLSVGAQTVAGTYPIQFSATGGSASQSATLNLTVPSGKTLTLTGNTGSMTVVQGASATLGLTSSGSGGFNSKVTLAVSGQPAGVTARLSAASFNAPGAGSSTLTLTAGTQTATGSYTVLVTAAGGGQTSVFPIAVTVAPAPGLTLSASGAATLAQGGTASVTISVAGTNNFNAGVALSLSGLPSGMAASYSPGSIAAPGSGTTTLTLNAGVTVALGSRTVTVMAKGGGLTQTLPLQVTVNPLPGFTMAEDSTSASVLQGGSAVVNLTITGDPAFNSAVAFTATGMPSGVTASFSPATLGAPGSGTSVLTLTASPTATVASRNFTITAKGGYVSKTLTFSLAVTTPPAFTLKESVTAATVARGSSTSIGVTLTEAGGFNAPVTLTVSGVPAGVSIGFSPVNNPSPGVYTLTVNLPVALNAAVGSSTITLSATGGGITQTVYYNLKVK